MINNGAQPRKLVIKKKLIQATKLSGAMSSHRTSPQLALPEIIRLHLSLFDQNN